MSSSMLPYASLFRPIDLFDPSTEIMLGYLFVAAIGLVVLKIYLRRRYHAFVATHLPEQESMADKKSPKVNTKDSIL